MFCKLNYMNVKGQAAILAVMLITGVALVSAGFVAFVANSIHHARALTERVSVEDLAMDGIVYAMQQLLTSPEGADWRPVPDVKYMAPNGYFLLKVSKRPDGYIEIDSIGRLETPKSPKSPVYYRMIAVVPQPIIQSRDLNSQDLNSQIMPPTIDAERYRRLISPDSIIIDINSKAIYISEINGFDNDRDGKIDEDDIDNDDNDGDGRFNEDPTDKIQVIYIDNKGDITEVSKVELQGASIVIELIPVNLENVVKNVVIFAEGDVRIKGIINASLTVISMGTIYIEGSLETADQTQQHSPTQQHIALLAKDDVCLDTEAFDPNNVNVKINAAIYAENGCFYIRPSPDDVEFDIEINGSIYVPKKCNLADLQRVRFNYDSSLLQNPPPFLPVSPRPIIIYSGL